MLLRIPQARFDKFNVLLGGGDAFFAFFWKACSTYTIPAR
jgi:hypothetical protein